MSTWPEMFRVFGRIGLLSFGGPAAQIAVMHRELVEDRPWLTETQYLNALSFCMLLPGPEAMQLATYSGWKMRGVPGGLLAGLLFVLPGALVMLLLAMAYTTWGQVPFVEAMFLGIKAAVVIVVIEALLRVARKSLKSTGRWIVAALSFVAIFVFSVPFPIIILAAAAYGAFTFATGEATDAALPTNTHTITTIAVWGILWWLPILISWMVGAQQLTEIGLFFSKLAIVTFGGAYAVLAYMTQQVVSDFGWLSTPQMMDGLGLAETTPGPLILVTEFVGYLAGYQQGGAGRALMAAAMTLWVTFVPCFLWIFAGAPYLEWIHSRPRLTGALSFITAAVVGVILNLSLWFALHVFFDELATLNIGPMSLLIPNPETLDFRAFGLALAAAWLLLRRHMNLATVLCLSAVGGILASYIL